MDAPRRHLRAKVAVISAVHCGDLTDRRSKADPTARRLMTIPGVGPIVSTAITALVPAVEGFRAGRDFAAWLGLTPVQKSTGGSGLGILPRLVAKTQTGRRFSERDG